MTVASWHVEIRPGAVLVDNRDYETITMALNKPLEMAKEIKDQSYEETGTTLKISDGFLAAEILSHASLYQWGIAVDHTDVANYGENDSERWYWNHVGTTWV
jgi:hypothetical protein